MIIGEFEETVEIVPDEDPVPRELPRPDESETPARIPEVDREGENTWVS